MRYTKPFLPHLDKGDILIDYGTFSQRYHPSNWQLRYQLYRYWGLVERGALEGPSIMPGGQKTYELVADVLEEILASTRRWQTMCDLHRS